MNNQTNKFYYLGEYNGRAYFRNTVTHKQLTFVYRNTLPEIGTVVTIMDSYGRTFVDFPGLIQLGNIENSIAYNMSEQGNANNQRALRRSIARNFNSNARRARRNSLKYQHSYFC